MRLMDWMLVGLAVAAILAIWRERREHDAEVRRLRRRMNLGRRQS